MRTIWVVFAGDYEQRGPRFACPRRDLAEEAARRLGLGEPVDLEEVALFESLDDAYRYPVYEVELDADGTELRRRTWVADSAHPVVEARVVIDWSGPPPTRDGRKLCTFRGVSTVGYDQAVRFAQEAMSRAPGGS